MFKATVGLFKPKKKTQSTAFATQTQALENFAAMHVRRQRDLASTLSREVNGDSHQSASTVSTSIASTGGGSKLPLLRGEMVQGESLDVHCSLFHKQEQNASNVAHLVLTNFRLRVVWRSTLLTSRSPVMDVPLLVVQEIEASQSGDQRTLKLRCKDIRVIYITFFSKRDQFYDMLRVKIDLLLKNLMMNHIFAFTSLGDNESDAGWRIYDSESELRRLGVTDDGVGGWVIDKHVNGDYQLAPTYPAVLGLPADVPASTIVAAASYRSKGRLPALVWRNPGQV
jgi:hypothetical protein